MTKKANSERDELSEASDCHSDSSDSLPLRKQVFRILEKDPYLKPKMICQLLKLDYKLRGNQVRQRRYEYLHDYCHNKNGVGSKCSTPDEQHHATAQGFVPKSLDRRAQGISDLVVESGWIASRNRNRVLVWKEPGVGRLEWWETGKVSAYVHPPARMDRVKKLLFKVFFETGLIFRMDLFDQFSDQFHWKSAHDVYRTGQTLPARTIRTYEPLGLVIKTGDRSHPDGIEVEWCRPEWAEQLAFFMAQDIELKKKQSEQLGRPRPLNPDDRSVV